MPRASNRNKHAFATEMLTHAFFGAFYLAIRARKKEEGLTSVELGSRMGRDKTSISKLLSAPRNWQLSTVSSLAEALDLRVEFSLVDRHYPERRFTPTGVVDDAQHFAINAMAPLNFNKWGPVNQGMLGYAQQQQMGLTFPQILVNAGGFEPTVNRNFEGTMMMGTSTITSMGVSTGTSSGTSTALKTVEANMLRNNTWSTSVPASTIPTRTIAA